MRHHCLLLLLPLLVAACGAPRLTVIEPGGQTVEERGDGGRVVYTDERNVMADRSACPDGLVAQFPDDSSYRLQPTQTRALINFRFRDSDGIRSAKVGFAIPFTQVDFPEDLPRRGAPDHGLGTTETVELWEFEDPAATRRIVDFAAQVASGGTSFGAVIFYRATDGNGFVRNGSFSIQPFSVACIPAGS